MLKWECKYKIIPINRNINFVLSKKVEKKHVTQTKMNIKNHTGHVLNTGN